MSLIASEGGTGCSSWLLPCWGEVVRVEPTSGTVTTLAPGVIGGLTLVPEPSAPALALAVLGAIGALRTARRS
ncbi:MAG TPA: hypothetical protein VIL25_05865 [Vicinamibacterales bacterium]